MSGRFGRMALDAVARPGTKMAEVKSMLASGATIAEIARKIGTSHAEVRHWLEEIKKLKEKDKGITTDPPVSEAQRRAMFAAKAGHSKLGIPKSVGEEFAEADPGGKLPEKKS